MNPYESIEVPDYVPHDWQELYGSERPAERPGHLDLDEPSSHETGIRLVIWLVAVVATLVAVMWLSTLVPRLVAVASVIAVGASAGALLTRWVLRPDRRASDGPCQ